MMRKEREEKHIGRKRETHDNFNWKIIRKKEKEKKE